MLLNQYPVRLVNLTLYLRIDNNQIQPQWNTLLSIAKRLKTLTYFPRKADQTQYTIYSSIHGRWRQGRD